MKGDDAGSAGDRVPPGAVFDVELVLGAAEQRADERERLVGGLRRAGVGAAGVTDELRLAAVVDFDDVQLLTGGCAHRPSSGRGTGPPSVAARVAGRRPASIPDQ